MRQRCFYTIVVFILFMTLSACGQENQDTEDQDDDEDISEAIIYDSDDSSEPVFTIADNQVANELWTIFERADECIGEVDVLSPDYEVEFDNNHDYYLWTDTTEIMEQQDSDVCSINEEDINRMDEILEIIEEDES